MTASQQPTDGSPTLARNAIGLPEVLFQSITHMAPAVATALSIGAATSFAGGITPLAVLFAMIAVLFTAYSMSELARHLPSAGGMYTYVGRGLGSFFGWLVAWSFALAEPLVMPLLLGGFGFYGAIFLSSYLSISSNSRGWPSPSCAGSSCGGSRTGASGCRLARASCWASSRSGSSCSSRRS